MPSLFTSMLLATAGASKINLDIQSAAEAPWSAATCPRNNKEVCDLTYNRALSENNSHAYLKYSNQDKYLFKDSSFPAGPASMGWGSMEGNSATIQGWADRPVPWARPSQMQTTDPGLWGADGETRPSAAQQGRLGDCWFLAAASSLAEFPDRIKKIFTNTAYSNTGVFQTKWYVGGEEVRITVDDRLPVNRELKSAKPTSSYRAPRPILSRKSPTGSWWLPILEKSFAKLNGNYGRLSGGWMTEAWRQMTNQPTIWIRTHKHTNEEIWDMISEWDRKNYVISTACFSGANGLVSGHAYSIIGAVTITLADGSKQRLVKARNPWGSEKYTGKWSDKSKLWTEDTRKQAGSVNKNDGIFFIPAEEYKTDFQELMYIAYKDDGWNTSTAKISDIKPGNKIMMELNVPEDTDFMIQCDQVYPRLFPRKGCENKVTTSVYAIYNSSGRRETYAWCTKGTDNHSHNLKKGKYSMKVVNKDKSKEGNYSFSTYSEGATVTLDYSDKTQTKE